MGLDLNKMKAKLAALKGNGGGGTSVFWKPQEGEQTIRIVPTEDGDPFKDYHFHYMNINGKNQSVMCPKRNFGEACPVCDFASNLWNEGQNGTPGASDEAKKLFAKQRFFSPVVVRGQEDQGVRIYGYSKTIYEQLLNILFDPDYGDITDIMEGNDIRLTYGRTAGRLFPETKIRVRPMKTALHENTDTIQTLSDGIPDFSTLFERKSTAEVQELLNQYIIGQDTEDSPNVEKYSGGGENSIERSFNELLNA